MPVWAKAVAEYMLYLTEYINEYNSPEEQAEKLKSVFASISEDHLPQTYEEFESRALVFHILMDLEDFLKYKMRFLKELDETKLKIYHKK